jgi:hypothetical protein
MSSEDKIKVKLPIGRVGFESVFEKTRFNKDNDSETPKFVLELLFDKDTDLEELKKAIATVMETNGIKKLQHPIFKDGNLKFEEKGYESCKDKIIVRAKSGLDSLTLVDEKIKPITDRSEFFSGCYAKAIIVVASYKYGGSKGITLYLQAVQRVKKGERIVMHDATEDFEVIETKEDEGLKDLFA